MPDFIDLHTHSNASDGTMTPSDLIKNAINCNLKAMALTDHDTVNGIPEALAEAEKYPDFELVPGIEMSCVYHGTEIHILGLYVDYTNQLFLESLKEIRGIRNNRNDLILTRLNEDGYQINTQDLTGNNPNTVITRAHFAKALTEKGYASSISQAFTKFLEYGGKYCTRREIVTPEQAMKILRLGNAFPVLAHPTLYHLGYSQIKELLSELIPQGLTGLEVYHSSNNQHESQRLREIARQYKLLPTGGSDFHGSNKPDIVLGRGRGNLRISYCLLSDIKASLKGRVQ